MESVSAWMSSGRGARPPHRTGTDTLASATDTYVQRTSAREADAMGNDSASASTA